MVKANPHPALRYAVAVGAVALAIGGRLLLDPALGDRFAYPTVFLALLGAAWFGGLGPSLVALFLGGLTATYLFVPPRGSLAVAGWERAVGLGMYTVVGVATVLVVQSLRAARLHAEEFAEHVRDRQRQIEHKLVHNAHSEEIRRQLAAIVKSSEDAIIGTTPDGIIVTWNYGAEHLYGYSSQEVRGKHVSILVPPGQADDFPDTLRKLRRGELIEPYEAVRVARDGKKVEVSVRISPVKDAAGELVGTSVIARDITVRKRLEESLRQRTEQLQEADTRKDEFLAILAHELRNPLAPIRNALAILRQPEADPAVARRMQEMMERQLEHLTRLVDDLLDVSRISRGKIELRKEPVELQSTIRQAVEASRLIVEDKEQALEVTVAEQPLYLDADRTRLAQVVSNLLTNAIKYTNRGGRIRLTAERQGDEAVLRVRDSGIGIAPEMLPRIFELFVQVDHATTRSQGGLGIGLTLVKNLVEMHRGTIEARSEGLGRGSEFTVRLPLLAGEQAERLGREKVERARATPSSGLRLMVVDDNQDAAESLALLLRLQGYEIQVAHDGPAALEMAVGYRPEVVFLDLGMPGMDGCEVARRMRRQPGLERVVLVAVTGWGQQEDRQRTQDAGFDHHMVKPVEPDDLQGLLARLPA